MKEETGHIVIGMATLIALIIIAVFSFASSKVTPASGVTLKAVFNQIDGLSIGDQVRLGGVVIGKVTDISLGSNYAAVVKFFVDDQVKVPNDTSAAIHTDGLFGGKFITLEPGGEEEYLGNTDEISMTQGAVVVQDLLDLIIGEAKSKRAKK